MAKVERNKSFFFNASDADVSIFAKDSNLSIFVTCVLASSLLFGFQKP